MFVFLLYSVIYYNYGQVINNFYNKKELKLYKRDQQTHKKMDGIEIDSQVLNAIFLDHSKFTPQTVQEINKWYQELQPSVNLTRSLLAAFLMPEVQLTGKNSNEMKELQQSQKDQNYDKLRQNQQTKLLSTRLQKAVQDVPKILSMLQQNKCPKNFIRAFSLLIKQNYQKIQSTIDKQYILSKWSEIPVEILQAYCQTFRISIETYSTDKGMHQNKQKTLQIKADQFDKKMDKLIHKRDYNKVFVLIKMSNCQKQHINKLLAKMTNNKQASKAADYIKQLKLDPADYPALGQRLYKNTARHFLSRNGWQYAEEIFLQHPDALACVVEDLIYKKKYKQALSVWTRNPICHNRIVKQQAVDFFKKHQQNIGADIIAEDLIENFLHVNQFGPTDKDKYLTLQQLGLTQNDIVWIDRDSEQNRLHLKQMMSANVIGIDTQSIVGQTKFQKQNGSKFQQAALIQIASKNKIYIIDGFKARQIPYFKEAMLSYIHNQGLIVGHTLDNDMESLLKSIGCEDDQIKQLKNIKVIDIWKLFKAIYPKKRFSSLAFISQTMLGKQICKSHTLSNWKSRPLRRNQLHYAAMDAVVVIKIYDKFVQEFGQQMIQYYCQMDANQL